MKEACFLSGTSLMIFVLVFPFLTLGCIAFLACSAIPPLRRYALGASLWCAACIPCLIATFITYGLAILGLTKLRPLLRWNGSHMVGFFKPSWIGWLFFTIMLIAVAIASAAIAAIHGIIIRRMTFALFRIYLAAVSFGVGVLSCLIISFVFAMDLLEPTRYIPIALLTLLSAAGLSYFCSSNAVHFRGTHPKYFPIVTPAEFNPER